jgi:alpha/beta superfamily hydrolase
MERARLIKLVGINLIILSLVLSLFSVLAALSLRNERLKFYNKEDIIVKDFYVKTRDNTELKGSVYIDKELEEEEDNSVPTILMINGINARKEFNLEKAFRLVKRGYAVFVVEQRGHGVSGGPSGFMSREPKDMEEVIDFIEDKYDFANTSHMGLLAFSYGGGIGAILQAKDDRIYATVLYHPLISLKGVTERIPFQNLVGTTQVIEDIDKIKDARDIADEDNSENLLIIQGMKDTVIIPEESEKFYNSLDGKDREDIALEKRPGLNHFDNEKNGDSFKYALVWFEHFYHDNSVNITNRDEEIKDISLEPFNYPDNILSEVLLITSVILLFIGMSLLMINFKITPLWENKSTVKIEVNTPEKKKRYKRMLLLRTIFYVVGVVISGIIFLFFNNSVVMGYFLFYPLITIIPMLFIPSDLHKNWKEEWLTWIRNDSKLLLYNIILISIPTILFISIFNLNTSLMLKSPIPFFNITFLYYICIFFSTIFLDYLYLREWIPRHSKILMVMRPMSLIIFVLFVPLKPFPLLGGMVTYLLLFMLIGVVLYYFRQFVLNISKFYKNTISMYGLIIFPIILICIYLFFRII